MRTTKGNSLLLFLTRRAGRLNSFLADTGGSSEFPSAIRVTAIQADGRELASEPGEQGNVLRVILTAVKHYPERQVGKSLQGIADFENI